MEFQEKYTIEPFLVDRKLTTILVKVYRAEIKRIGDDAISLEPKPVSSDLAMAARSFSEWLLSAQTVECCAL